MLARKVQLERAKAHLERLGPAWVPVFGVKNGGPSGVPESRSDSDASGHEIPLRLAKGALHEIRIEDWRNHPAAVSFALALAGLRAREKKGAIVFLQRAHDTRETGMLFARGLIRLGVDLGNVVVALARDEKQMGWALEEASREKSVAAVIADASDGRLLDLTATRRISLASESSGASPVILRRSTNPTPTSAFIRWRIEAAPSTGEPDDEKVPGAPRWRVFLERHRAGGRLCVGSSFITELLNDGLRIQPEASPVSVPSLPLLGDGSAQAGQPFKRPASAERRACSL